MNETHPKSHYLRWVVRMAAMTVAAGAVAFLAGSDHALAAQGEAGAHSPARALLLMAIVWLVGGMRIRRNAAGRKRLAFEPSPVPRLEADRPRRSRRPR